MLPWWKAFITYSYQCHIYIHWCGVGGSLCSGAPSSPGLRPLVPMAPSVLFLPVTPCTLFHIPVLFHRVFWLALPTTLPLLCLAVLLIPEQFNSYLFLKIITSLNPQGSQLPSPVLHTMFLWEVSDGTAIICWHAFLHHLTWLLRESHILLISMLLVRVLVHGVGAKGLLSQAGNCPLNHPWLHGPTWLWKRALLT